MSGRGQLPQLMDCGAERALLACASIGGAEVLTNLVGWVDEDWFGMAAHQLAWRVLNGLIVKGMPLDSVLIRDELIRAGMDQRDAGTITEEMARLVPNSANWKYYAAIVEKFRKRRLGVSAAQRMLAQFQDMSADPSESLAACEAELFKLHAMRQKGGARHRREFVKKVLDDIGEAWGNRGHVIGGIGTGYTDLDRLAIKGMRPAHFWLIGAPPGGGKTVLLGKMLDNIARASMSGPKRCGIGSGSGDYREFKQEPRSVLLVSLEMDGHELTERDVIREARITMNQGQRGQISRQDYSNLADTTKALNEAPYYIAYFPAMSIQALRVLLRYLQAVHNFGVIGIDYVQKLTSDTKSAKDSRTVEMQEISTGLDMIAGEIGVPIIAACQLKVEAYTGRPKLEHLRESAQLCQDADLVALLSPWNQAMGIKPEKKDAAEKKKGGRDPAPWESEEDEDAPPPELGDFMALDVVKNRHGGNTNSKPPIKLQWDREYYDFVSTCDRLFDSTGKTTQQ